jgi:hypothetical protein
VDERESPQVEAAARVAPLAIVLLLVVACAHGPRAEDLLAWEGVPHAPAVALTPEQVTADVDLLLFALREGYGGRRFVQPEQLHTAVAALEALKAQPPSTAQALCTAIAQALVPIADNHLRASLDRSCQSGYAPAVGHVGPNFAASKVGPWAVDSLDSAQGKIARISITEMPMHEDEVWSGFLQAARDALSGARAAVIDLRGNGGGDDTTGLKLAEIFWGGPTPWLSYRVVSQTPATQALAMNNTLLQVRRLEAKHESVPDYLHKRLEEQRHSFEAALAGRLPPEIEERLSSGGPFDAAQGFDRPVYILIDHACASSCESTLDAFERHPRVLTVGENTGGFIHFGNMGMAVLPRSGIVVQLATDFWKYDDGRYLEKIGIAPKLRVPPGADAMTAALEHFAAASGGVGH